jgi:hypothetical protein
MGKEKARTECMPVDTSHQELRWYRSYVCNRKEVTLWVENVRERSRSFANLALGKPREGPTQRTS